jgi:hypothetical protein
MLASSGGDHRALSRPYLTDRDDPVFQDTRLEPFADEADDALVADAIFTNRTSHSLLTESKKAANTPTHSASR